MSNVSCCLKRCSSANMRNILNPKSNNRHAGRHLPSSENLPMDHPILYGRHASHLWDGQSAFQVLFQHLQKTELFFFNTNGENHRRYIILKEQSFKKYAPYTGGGERGTHQISEKYIAGLLGGLSSCCWTFCISNVRLSELQFKLVLRYD